MLGQSCVNDTRTSVVRIGLWPDRGDTEAHSLAWSLLLGYRGALHLGLITGDLDAADDAIDALTEDSRRRMNGLSE